MKSLFAIFLSEYPWFRRWHGGKWMRSFVDFPVCGYQWMKMPDDATASYREPLWRGIPYVEVYPS